MKTNLPVTDNEVFLRDDDAIVTKADLKGVITYANDDFCKVSGFERCELIGNNHNVVLHPDMPVEAFADLWITVQKGKPWTAWSKIDAKTVISTGLGLSSQPLRMAAK